MTQHARLVLLAVVSCTPLTTWAQQAPESDATVALEEVVVTAQKREANLQDVPFSVAAVTEQQIARAGVGNIVELARNVPGLAITDLGPGQSQVAIRGISAGQVVRDQPGVKESVGVYLDESAISVALFTPDLELFDLERFEVLRGPQGTLFGAGSSSGTLRYITRQPKLGDFEGAAEFQGQNSTDGEFGGSVKGAVNAPLGDTAALRLVGYYTKLGGFIDSVYPGRGSQEDVNSGDRTGARVALLIQPNENLSITPRLIYQKLETDGYPREDFYNVLGNPFTTTQPAITVGEREQVTQLREGLDDDFKLADLKIEARFGDLTLTSITSYTDREVVVLRDASQLTGSVTFQLGGTPTEVRLNSPLFDTTDLQAISQELRLSSGGDGAFQWLVGAFYQQVDRDYGQNLPTPGYDAFLTRVGIPTNPMFGAPVDTPFFSDLTYDFEQLALFGEATYRFNDQWSLTGGLRYYDFEEDRLLTFAGVFVDQTYTNEPGSVSSDGVSPRVILAFKASEDVLLSAQVARGFRLGGINDPLNITLCSPQDLVTYGGRPTFDDEKNLNIELGAKTRFANGRVQLNAAVFYSDISDLQVIADAGSCSSRIVLNGEGESRGIEVELFARPTDQWDFGISATYADAEISKTLTDATGTPIAGIREGNRLPTAPEFQAAATATYSWPWSTSLEGYANLTWQYVGSSYTQLADQEAPFGCVGCPGAPGFFNFGAPTISRFQFETELPAYDIANFRFGVRTDRWEAAAFVNNLADERASLSLDRERGSRARVGYLTNQPRTFGVNFKVNF
jgi:iron complex outermembrane receptor protein